MDKEINKKIREQLKDFTGCDYYMVAQEIQGIEVMGDCIYKDKTFLGLVLSSLIKKDIKSGLLVVGFKNVNNLYCDRVKTIKIEKGE